MMHLQKAIGLILFLSATCLTAEEAKPSPLKEIAPLVTMLGKWLHDSEGAMASLDVKWSKDRQFLERDVQIKIGGKDDLNIRQTIFWDPAQKKIRSLGFASDGGFEEGIWSVKDGAIHVERKITYPDGSTGKALNIWEFVDKDHCYLTSRERVVKGEKVPDLVAMEMERIQ